MSDSFPPALRPFSTLAKVCGVIVAIAAVAAPVLAWGLSRPSRAETATQADDARGKAEKAAALALAEHARLDAAEGVARREETIAVIEMAVSGLAADMESDRRKKFAAAATARGAFRDALARGMPPLKAADYARDVIQRGAR